MSDAIIRLKNIDKSFGSLKILRNLSLDIHKNQMTVIYGPSGCGKSTLLNLIGLLDTVDKGDLYMFDKQVPKPFSKQAQKLLSESIGYLFQNFALIEHKSVEYNLALAIPKSKAEFRASTISKALEDVGLKGFE
ncbi:MAG: ATP-binding cassette domain-containing protein, partial [Erysipelotrichaceae bacterium]|nr:ATP-binding cassette domain-containing protein [Erysipelotrichaceae bacterium]